MVHKIIILGDILFHWTVGFNYWISPVSWLQMKESHLSESEKETECKEEQFQMLSLQSDRYLRWQIMPIILI